MCSSTAEVIQLLLQHVAFDRVVEVVRELRPGPRSGRVSSPSYLSFPAYAACGSRLLLALRIGGYRDPRCSRTYLAFVRQLPLSLIHGECFVRTVSVSKAQ